MTNIIPTNFNGSTLINFINHRRCLAKKILVVYVWLPDSWEREIHALSHYHSLTTLAFNHNQRKTLFSCNFVQNLTARESKVTVVEKVEDNVFVCVYPPCLHWVRGACFCDEYSCVHRPLTSHHESVPELPTLRHTSGQTMQYDMLNIYMLANNEDYVREGVKNSSKVDPQMR